uniref:RNase H type-1 domain-containing protein n=1 Tax=Noccaea caerulescens TaxID=107243 RepID=A0A1J3EB08_NOCCA
MQESDAAWNKDLHVAGLAWIFSRQADSYNLSQNQTLDFVNSPLMAEGLAIRAALEHALNLDFRRIFFESDSMQLGTATAEGSSFSNLHGGEDGLE